MKWTFFPQLSPPPHFLQHAHRNVECFGKFKLGYFLYIGPDLEGGTPRVRHGQWRTNLVHPTKTSRKEPVSNQTQRQYVVDKVEEITQKDIFARVK